MWTPIKEYTDILFEKQDGVAKITINRPKVYNAFRPLTNQEMLDAMRICREDNSIRVVILTGAGDKAFCSGGDQHYKGPLARWARAAPKARRTCSAIRWNMKRRTTTAFCLLSVPINLTLWNVS